MTPIQAIKNLQEAGSKLAKTAPSVITIAEVWRLNAEGVNCLVEKITINTADLVAISKITFPEEI